MDDKVKIKQQSLLWMIRSRYGHSCAHGVCVLLCMDMCIGMHREIHMCSEMRVVWRCAMRSSNARTCMQGTHRRTCADVAYTCAHTRAWMDEMKLRRPQLILAARHVRGHLYEYV